jgi:cytochrome b involved in lipid metabolism
MVIAIYYDLRITHLGNGYEDYDAFNNESGRTVTMEEVSQHSAAESCWCVIHGVVYDVTSFLQGHPGGASILIKYAGKDATKPFDASGHPKDIVSKLGLERLIIGDLEAGR